ncbi:zinc ribbon domain-containing protein [Lactococcus petauri]|uniref:zinc ribbon domain-containing protein n=1 Tax=Lactococcus petauri TaxID=1940789 RepID=UPI0034DB3E83
MSDALRQSKEGSGPSAPAAAGVRCPQCGAQNAPTAKFCVECGAKQGGAKCANCQSELAPGAKFCNECGQKV